MGWLSNKPSNVFQNISIIFSVIGVIISAILSGWAIGLTIRYGENREQIDTLIGVAKRQDKEIQRLDKIISRVDIQIAELKTSNDNLSKQTSVLNKQLIVSTIQQTKANAYDSLTNVENYNRFKFTLSKLQIIHLNLLDTYSDDRDAISVLQSLKSVLESDLDNPYMLKKQGSLMKKWRDLYITTVKSLYNYDNGLPSGVTKSQKTKSEKMKGFDNVTSKLNSFVIYVLDNKIITNKDLI